VTDRRAPTSDDVSEWKRDTRSDMHKLLEDIRDLRAENKDLLTRIVILEQFKAWHDRTFDALVAKVERIDRLTWIAAGAGAATGGAAATVIRLLGGL
jgi:acyl-CoA reductase-like NAD-dependent aldehyde dehydrogenase